MGLMNLHLLLQILLLFLGLLVSLPSSSYSSFSISPEVTLCGYNDMFQQTRQKHNDYTSAASLSLMT